MSKQSVPAVIEPSVSSPHTRRFSDDSKLVGAAGRRRAVHLPSGGNQNSLRDWHAKFAPPPTPYDEHPALKNQRLRQQLKRAEVE